MTLLGSAVAGRPPLAIRAAAATYVVLGLGFGTGSVVTLVYLAREGELPMTPWGFRSMSGPFEELGPDAFTLLGAALVWSAPWTWWPGCGCGRVVDAAPGWRWPQRRSPWALAPDSPCRSSSSARRSAPRSSSPVGEGSAEPTNACPRRGRDSRKVAMARPTGVARARTHRAFRLIPIEGAERWEATVRNSA